MKKILIVDYDQGSLASLQGVLAGEGYTVVTAADGQAGWDKYNKESPDLVLMEAMLPKVHGFELCQRITSERNSQATVFIMTGVYKDRVYRTEALRTYGASEYFEKPLKMAELLASVQAVLGKPEPKPEEEVVAAEPQAPVREIRAEAAPAEPRKRERARSDDSLFSLPEDLDRMAREIPKMRRAAPATHGPSVEPRLEALADDLLKSVIVESKTPKASVPKPGNGNGNGNGNGKAEIDEFMASALAGFDLNKEKIKVPKTAPLPPPPAKEAPVPTPPPVAAREPKPAPAPPRTPAPEPTSRPARAGRHEEHADAGRSRVRSVALLQARQAQARGAGREAESPAGRRSPGPRAGPEAGQARREGRETHGARPRARPSGAGPPQARTAPSRARRAGYRQEGHPADHQRRHLPGFPRNPGKAAVRIPQDRRRRDRRRRARRGRVHLPAAEAPRAGPCRASADDPGRDDIEHALPAGRGSPASRGQARTGQAEGPAQGQAGRSGARRGRCDPPEHDRRGRAAALGRSTRFRPGQRPDRFPLEPVQAEAQQAKTEEAPPAKTEAEAPQGGRPRAAENAEPTPIVPPVNEGDLVELSSVTEVPKLVKSADPIYPQTAQRLGVGGSITVNALIDEKGNVTDTAILKGIKDDKGLGRAAETAVRKWKFQPARKNGVAVKVWKSFVIAFKAEANPANRTE